MVLPLKRGLKRVGLFLAILGPGFITSTADNDAGGIATYAAAGAQEGYGMLWALLLITLSLGVIQEMSARMGLVTGQGLGGLIREKFGVKTTVFAMGLLLFANLFVTISNFSGVAASLEIFHIPRYVSVPLAAALILRLIMKGSYRSIEKIFLLFALFYFSYVVSGFLAKPVWGEVWKGFVPAFRFSSPGYLALFIAFVGTTITPWMQFYLQSSVVDKRLTEEDLPSSTLEVYIGAFFTDFIDFFIIVATAATLFKSGVRVESASQAALALKPLAGPYCMALFSFGLLNASILAASILPLSTAYALCDAFGWESGLDRKFREAPLFFSLAIATTLIGAAAVLVPGLDLMKVMLYSQTTNGVLLPFILLFMLLIVNDKTIMGKHTNGWVRNLVAWATAVSLIVMTILLLYFSLLGRGL